MAKFLISKPGDVDVAMNRVISTIARKFEEVNSESARIMQEAGEIILEEAIDLTPKETNALRESGRVFVGTKADNVVTVIVGFGGNVRVTPTANAKDGIVDYAIIVHEDMETSHPVGQAKFLEEGTKRSLDRVKAFIEKEYKRLFT